MTQALDIRLRLASLPRDPTLADGLQAGLGDPLWLLTRQWQLGELQGEDAGSPAWVRARGSVRHLSRYLDRLPDGSAGRPLDTDAVPLERLVENEQEPAGASTALAARVGRHYLRLLARGPASATRSAYAAALAGTHPLDVSGLPDGDPLRLTATGAPDGAALVADLRAALAAQPPGLPATPPVAAADVAAVTAAARALVSWFDATTGSDLPASAAWRTERLEYRAAVASPDDGSGSGLTLVATEFDDGDLDWSDFDVVPGTGLGAAATDPGAVRPDLSYTSLPTPVTYRGMPSPVFWEFEDAAVDFGAVSAPAEELVTLLVVEFAMRYGNDFFLVPWQVDVGSVCRLTSLVVGTTFGERVLVDPLAVVDGPQGRFRLFEQTVLSATPARCSSMVLFPAADAVLESAPLERLTLLRDEAADVAWAVERTAPDAWGRPADRDAAAARSRTDPPGGSADPGHVTYALRTEVADNWYPLLPGAADGPSWLRWASVEPLPGRPAQPPPAGALGRGLAAARVPAEEVTRDGAEVERRYRYTRWTDGAHHLWVGRRRGPAGREGSSGLRFDVRAD